MKTPDSRRTAYGTPWQCSAIGFAPFFCSFSILARTPILYHDSCALPSRFAMVYIGPAGSEGVIRILFIAKDIHYVI